MGDVAIDEEGAEKLVKENILVGLQPFLGFLASPTEVEAGNETV